MGEEKYKSFWRRPKQRFTMNPMVTTFSPNVDRYVVPDFPAIRYRHGEYMKIPLLAR
jgi:hypothetical protein